MCYQANELQKLVLQNNCKRLNTMKTLNCLGPSLSWIVITIFALSWQVSDGCSAIPLVGDCDDALKWLFIDSAAANSCLTDSSTAFNASFADWASEANSCLFSLQVKKNHTLLETQRQQNNRIT